MPSMKAIKRRRSTVKNISQITKAMNLVATSKLQRSRNNLKNVGTAAQAALELMGDALADVTANRDEVNFVTPRKNISKTGYILITSNRGLCGGYNSNVCKELARHVKQTGKNPLLFPLGKKGREYFRRREFETLDVGTLHEVPVFEEAHKLALQLAHLYETGEIDEVYIVYTKFITVLALEPIVRKLLPLDISFLRQITGKNMKSGEEWDDLGFFKNPHRTERVPSFNEGEYDPGSETIIDSMVPWYLSVFIYAAMACSALCEQAAVMTSMDSATKNAGDIIEKLTLMFNRQRQSSITQEITEIVSSASALK
jgi:F-type H+-transporting ATPase subunit gamma